MFIKYIYALVEKIQKMLWLSVLKDTFIEQFTVDFSEQDTCKYTTCSKKSKIWLISGLKSWTCSIGERNYVILMFICRAHNVHWTVHCRLFRERCLQMHYMFQKIQNLAYKRIEKLSLLNWGRKLRHFDVHLPST